jgi:hypothetical protein
LQLAIFRELPAHVALSVPHEVQRFPQEVPDRAVRRTAKLQVVTWLDRAPASPYPQGVVERKEEAMKAICCTSIRLDAASKR